MLHKHIPSEPAQGNRYTYQATIEDIKERARERVEALTASVVSYKSMLEAAETELAEWKRILGGS